MKNKPLFTKEELKKFEQPDGTHAARFADKIFVSKDNGYSWKPARTVIIK